VASPVKAIHTPRLRVNFTFRYLYICAIPSMTNNVKIYALAVLTALAEFAVGTEKGNSFLTRRIHKVLTQNVVASEDSHQQTDLHLLFVTDCSAHQRWMAFNVFNSAREVGQNDPITWLRSGCKSEASRQDLDAVAALYPHGHLMDLNGGKSGSDFNLGFGVPKALQIFLDTSNSIANHTVLALIEADMIFLSRLRIDDLSTAGLPWEVHTSNSFLSENTGVSAHYLCCDGLGPPYILPVQGWRKLTPLWNKAGAGKGWGADQEAIAEAAKEAAINFNIFDHFMVSSPSTTPAGWGLVEEALQSPAGDVCATKKAGVQPGLRGLPTFMHVVEPWTLETKLGSWGFSKYQVPPGWKRPQQTDGVLECGMPLFAEPPTSLLTGHGITDAGKLSGWVICTVVHSLNSMLVNYKKQVCPSGFNSARALKMNVPLKWTNHLLEGAVESAPNGTDIEWMERCAQIPDC